MKDINSYLVFNGNAKEAMQFYGKCLGIKPEIMTFGEAKIPCSDNDKERIMHAAIKKGDVILMASDTMPGDTDFKQGNNVSLNIDCESVEEIERIFKALSTEGEIKMPLAETFWAERYGMLKDRFGIHWMFNLAKAH